MNICDYNLDLQQSLLNFMISEYPNRDSKYLEWWLKGASDISEDKWCRTFVIKDEREKIVGCTSAFWAKMAVHGMIREFYWEGNTIVSPLCRGKGIGRLLYEHQDLFLDRCTTGFTDMAYKIEFKISKNIKHISSVSVYLSFTRFFMKSLFERIFNKNLCSTPLDTPETICFKEVEAIRVDALEHFRVPNNGIWMNDEIEIVRDMCFIKKRFFDIYRKYSLYQLYDRSRVIGYFVLRRSIYSGVNLLSLVDYRVIDHKYYNTMMKLVSQIARRNKIGVIITLTSQKDFSRLFPLTIRTHKELYGGTTMPELKDGQEFLITSADADLDFVYYK